ncbi:hypothetical protein OHA61_24440 [Streptomyces sp. NBC_00885]|uniref:hypothetical protein n=1 Tax=Streptomyces sp. NBC_00885 TaxID=2975857 RepID=UPI003870A281|nr:hypothetical protein OHA61_24440 [Streptomyces sp. NBC_00885]
MTRGETVRTGGVPDLIVWIDHVPDAIDRLREEHLPDDVRLDFGVESLAHVEAALLRHHAAEGSEELGSGFVNDATAYLGEVLLTVAGGGWGWDTEPAGDVEGHPVVVPDAALGLPPVAPVLLIGEALSSRTGHELTTAARRLGEAVDGLRKERPDWEPVKEHTPGVDPEPEVPVHPWLADWLAERERAFSAWVEETGLTEETWDYSASSLDVLERLAKERVPSAQRFEAAEPGLFLQGAAWYVGEVARRMRGAAWAYMDPEEHDSTWAGQPYMTQPGVRDGNIAAPMAELYAAAVMAEEGESGVLRERLSWYKES